MDKAGPAHPNGERTRTSSWRWLRRLGVGLLAFLVCACLLLLPYTLSSAGRDAEGRPLAPRYAQGDLAVHLLPPSWAPMRADERDRFEAAGRPAHPLGTDKLGRDLFIRCLAGGGVSLIIGLAAAAISLVIGTLYGSLAAVFGGRIDAIMMRIVDVLFGLPYVLLVVLLAVAGDAMLARHAALRGDIPEGARLLLEAAILLIAIGGLSWLTMSRVIRGQVLALRAQLFMEAARAAGIPAHRQFLRHLLPNLVAPITVYATLTVPQAILQESFLSFLGIGVRPPLPSWGSLAAEGLVELNPVRVRWWLLVFPCTLLGVTLLGLNLVGERLRESLDPKGRGR